MKTLALALVASLALAGGALAQQAQSSDHMTHDAAPASADHMSTGDHMSSGDHMAKADNMTSGAMSHGAKSKKRAKKDAMSHGAMSHGAMSHDDAAGH